LLIFRAEQRLEQHREKISCQADAKRYQRELSEEAEIGFFELREEELYRHEEERESAMMIIAVGLVLGECQG